MAKKFNCDRCGLCCQNLDRSHLYDDLNSGNGVCKFFDLQNKLCTIYERRPEKCNVSKSYKFFKDICTYEEYLLLNYKSCKILKEEH